MILYEDDRYKIMKITKRRGKFAFQDTRELVFIDKQNSKATKAEIIDALWPNAIKSKNT